MEHKRIGLLTLDSRTYNYGGLLQAYALLKVIQGLGYDCEIIDYDATSERSVFSMRRDIRNFSFHKVHHHFSRKVFYPRGKQQDISSLIKMRKSAFDRFREANMKLSEQYKYPELSTEALPYDAVVCGSDQIWNPDFCAASFFLGFAEERMHKVIYAASIGKTKLTRRQLNTYASLMGQLKDISVREPSAQALLKGITREHIHVVLDPTLLIEEDGWRSVANQAKTEHSNYLFCYFLENALEKQRAARAFADKHNLKILTIPYLHDIYEEASEHFGDWQESAVGPAEFLNMILNASFVLTDSFHATVFSLLFHKRFWVFGRKSGNYNMNTRVEALLSYFHMENRLIDPQKILEQQETAAPIDNEPINAAKEYSINYLARALREKEGDV